MICIKKENLVQLESRIKYKEVLAKEIKSQSYRALREIPRALERDADSGIAEVEDAKKSEMKKRNNR